MMQQVRSSREPGVEAAGRGGGGVPLIVRTDLSSLLSDYSTSQKHCNERLESLEREMASLKGQVNHVFTATGEQELNRTFTTKKTPVSQPTSARVMSPSRIPLPVTARKPFTDETSTVHSNDGPFSRALPPVAMVRSKSFHVGSTQPSSPPSHSNEATLLRSYKTHLEQIFRKDAAAFSDVKVPTYSTIEDVIKANEQLLLENERLRSELNRLKTESIVLLRSMKSTPGFDSNLGNERIMAERERQELTIELARQVEENKRLRKSLLAQSAKYLTLRQSANASEAASANDHRLTPESAPQPSSGMSKFEQSSKSARLNLGRGLVRARTFYHASHDPS